MNNYIKFNENRWNNVNNDYTEPLTHEEMEEIKMNKKILLGIIIVISLGLGIYGYMVLPDMVTVQIDISGNPSNIFPKILAVVLPILLSIGGGLGYYFSKEKEKKYLILSVIGLLISVITLIFNR